MTTRLLLNGKKVGLDSIREAVFNLRDEGYDLQVRPTWEGGDIERLVREADEQGVKRIIAGGGDGTINEVVNAIAKQSLNHIEVALLPLGTANDFATACGIPVETYQALSLALNGDSYWVDAVSANEQYFINTATAGFGAQVTATTPVALKNFLGGGAYTLSGLVQAINFQPFVGKVTVGTRERMANVVVGAVCNGRTAGGGQPLAPNAYIDDGVLDTFTIESFTSADIATVLEELQSDSVSTDSQFVHKQAVKSVEWQSDVVMPINLDGEPISASRLTIKVVPGAIKLVLPNKSPVLINHRKAI